MFARPPGEREWVSWLYVFLWSLGIYLSIPFVRAFVRYVDREWGRELFIYVVVAVAVVMAALCVAFLLRRRGAPVGSYLWLLAVAAIFIGYALSLRASPPEAIHFIEYGVLSLLLFRALSHRIRDASIYVIATLCGTIVGIIDEAIQWAVPRRFWDLRDIGFNLVAVALVQLAIWRGIRPAIISATPDAARIRLTCRFALVAVCLLGVSFVNTPDRVDWYVDRAPFLAFLHDPLDNMIEYGYRYSAPDSGTFQSRLSLEELERLDRERAPEASEVLDSYRDPERYVEFLTTYTVSRDPFLHEARVHLFRRDRFVMRAEEETDDQDRRREFFTVAYWENRILEKHFGRTLAMSSYVWPPELKAQVERNALPGYEYQSAVSRRLLTGVSEPQAIGGLVVVLALLLFLGGFWGRAPKSDS